MCTRYLVAKTGRQRIEQQSSESSGKKFFSKGTLFTMSDCHSQVILHCAVVVVNST